MDPIETNPDLEPWLEASLGGDIVSRYDLPTEAQLHARHAELARLTRESRSFRLVPVERTDDERAE